jgi:thiol-disulfide isomerase/thioredoxin
VRRDRAGRPAPAGGRPGRGDRAGARPGRGDRAGGRAGLGWRVAGSVLVVGVLLAGCTGGGGEPVPAASGSARAVLVKGCSADGQQSTAAAGLPDLALPCLGAADGEATVPLRRLTGRPLVLNLWASWCPPCREELPAFARLSADAGARLRVVGVASQDVPANSVAYAADAGLPFASLQDRAGDLGRALGRRGLPVTVLVTADGTVARVYQGPPLTDATLRALVRDTLRVDV